MLSLVLRPHLALPNTDLIYEAESGNVPLDSSNLSTPITSYLAQDSFDTFFQQHDEFSDMESPLPSEENESNKKKLTFLSDDNERHR